MEELELICFNIISFVGTAKSLYLEAIQEARNGDFEKAEKMLEEGKEIFVKGHQVHANLIQKEAAGEGVKGSLLLMHAEDQLMQADLLATLCDEFIYLYRKVNG